MRVAPDKRYRDSVASGLLQKTRYLLFLALLTLGSIRAYGLRFLPPVTQIGKVISVLGWETSIAFLLSLIHI